MKNVAEKINYTAIYLLTSSVTSKYPWAAAPFAWTTLSGMRSRAKWAILSIRLKSCMSRGPLGPADREFWLSSNGAPLEAVMMDCFMSFAILILQLNLLSLDLSENFLIQTFNPLTSLF